MKNGTESEKLEFKTSFGEWKEIVETLCAFANKKGGRVIVGLDDRGRPAALRLGKGALEDFANRVKNHTDPALYPSINAKTFGPGEIVEIDVQESDNKPVFAFDKAYVRVGRSNHKLSNSAVRTLIKKYTLPDFDEQLMRRGLKTAELDLELLQSLNKTAFRFKTADARQILRRLKLLRGGRLTKAGYLCFVKDNGEIPCAWVKAARFKGGTTADFIDMKDFRSGLASVVGQALEFIRRHTSMAVVIGAAARREEAWAYPLAALREAVTNAVIHRDYSDAGNIQIRIFDERLEVWSPGLLPKELNIRSLLSESRSIPRNKNLAAVFYAAGLMESWGTGFSRMAQACAANGNPPPEFGEKAGAFVITFYKKKTRAGGAVNGGANGGVTGGAGKLLEYIKSHPGKRTGAIAEALGEPLKTIEHRLERLKAAGRVRYTGSSKTGGYFLT